MPCGGSALGEGLGESRAGKPANSPVGAISRRHRTQKAVPFFIALDLLIALDLPFAVMIAVWQAKLAGFWSRSHIRNNVIAGIIVGVVTAAQPPVDV